MNVLLGISAALFEVFALWYIWHRGVRVIIDDLITGLNRLIEGPGPKPASIETGNCEVQHEIARLETEIYGRVLSYTTAVHISICPVSSIMDNTIWHYLEKRNAA